VSAKPVTHKHPKKPVVIDDSADELSAGEFSDGEFSGGNDSAGDQSSGDASNDDLSAGDLSESDDQASFISEDIDVATNNTAMSGIDADDDISVELKEDKPASFQICGKLYYVVAPTHSPIASATRTEHEATARSLQSDQKAIQSDIEAKNKGQQRSSAALGTLAADIDKKEIVLESLGTKTVQAQQDLDALKQDASRREELAKGREFDNNKLLSTISDDKTKLRMRKSRRFPN